MENCMSTSHSGCDDVTPQDVQRLKILERDQAELNTSLLRLTTHFAQVQFRLKQIVAAENSDKEALLRDLEEFAFQGCPNVQSVLDTTQVTEQMGVAEHERQLEQQRQKQQELVAHLQLQLEDIDNCTDQSVGSLAVGEETSSLAVKQKYIIEKLKRDLNIKLDDIETMSPEELKATVDAAVGAVTRPARSKEQTIQMLRTQVADLERYISFLQASPDNPNLRPSSDLPHSSRLSLVSSASARDTETATSTPTGLHVPSTGTDGPSPGLQAIRTEAGKLKSVGERCMSVMKKSLSVMHIVATTQAGLSGQQVQDKLTRLSSEKKQHPSYEGALAALGLAVDNVVTVYASQSDRQSNEQSSENCTEVEADGSPKVTLPQVVRKELGNALLALFTHGLMNQSGSQSWLNFIGCISASSRLLQSDRSTPWHVFLHYYHLKQGDVYNASTPRTLAMSFNVDVTGGSPVTAKQTLLSAIHHVKLTHEPLKKSPDSQFRSLICAGLNEGQLSEWCQLVCKCIPLIDEYYHPWSYVSAGFTEASSFMERLSGLRFSLPVDLPIQQFADIREAFSDPF
ncbi:RUN domain-containing protein 1-like isoform X2 [Corticium candelabrum]|uniref:RUN domain-containing protein 1-like isoform X2 n=1 Tax=Corticium candelabrum TaxID=121492 RepID=UPI002E26CF98|nr:RUN domain-containing protein 1-like isoform X2 [Corticium candelabrum]